MLNAPVDSVWVDDGSNEIHEVFGIENVTQMEKEIVATPVRNDFWAQVKASGVSTPFFKDLREISSNDVLLIVFIMKIVRMMQVYSVLQDDAMGLVLSAEHVRGWTTGSGMEGPPVSADGGGENISTFPWSFFTKSPRRHMHVAFTCNMCGQRTTRLSILKLIKDGTVFVQVKLSGSFM